MQPLVFEPYFRPMIWGGRKLGELFSKPIPVEGTYGESWEVSPHPHHESRVAEGDLAGKTLVEVCREHPREVFGDPAPDPPRFPLLIKLLDCRELLSIQVHPTDALAGPLAGETYGKTESWVVLHVEPTAKIYAGFRPGVTREEVERRLADGTLGEVLHGFKPNVGDCVFLPAGTVHAVGGGVVMAEVQQASDATFRLYDWNRLGADGKPRQLHLREALEAIDWSAGPIEPVAPTPIDARGPGIREEKLVRCPYFGLDRITIEGECKVAERDRPTVWMVLAGDANLAASAGYRKIFSAGQTVLLPAALGPASWRPAARSATLLRITIPDSATGGGGSSE